MNLYDPHFRRPPGARLFCDLTQSWSDVGGGVRTYLLHKRRHILESTPHRHLMIIPGDQDSAVEQERGSTVTNAPVQSIAATTWSMHRVSASTSAGSTAGNMPIRSWLRPSFR